MKNDQDGSRPRDPRHVYANPMMPDICPVLSFGIYFAVLGFASGAHSARKGAATYVSSCSTSGPSAASNCLRVGWPLHGVEDKYVRFEAAGDMIVGRYAAGLPFDSPQFAILPAVS
ncbi:hypothetical protein JG688_00018269 [Phytophthora aleatoria]|uniref:Uncharacterized protein n=1 Tax=Phytophthora aleatoria TaxID=2496075 RepID=A0A8J5LY07_9STRA|nr:hypothetical protein JG688_00018269 [Phytophthora aleatoria]